MPTSIQIASLTANTDGLTASAVIQGTPSGSVAFYASPYPDGTDMVQVSTTGTGPYTLTFDVTDLWYVWVQDNAGRIPEPEAVWLMSFDGLCDDVGQGLTDILDANRKGIQAGARRVYPNVNLSQRCITYGYPAVIAGDLGISVAEPSVDWEWIAAPNTRLLTFTERIVIGVLHNTGVTELPLAMKLGGAVMALLNRRVYNLITLSSGMQLFNCYAARANGRQMEQEGTGRFVSEVDVNWTAQATIMMNP